MGREIRRVPPTWEHPKNALGNFVPLFDGWRKRCADAELWRAGRHPHQDPDMTWEGYAGDHKQSDYMPDWPEEERTHVQLYETTTEGTPLSPIFATLDELCIWAAENATTFADFRATREQWKEMLCSPQG